jgi:glycosyltransferase involved in cell wall biosynthesis
LNQTYNNFELIIIDDGSTDDTKSILTQYKENNKVRIFYRTHCGLSNSRNFGISQSRSDLICFHDADDIMLPDRLYNSAKYSLLNKEIDVFYGSYFLTDKRLQIDKSVDAVGYSYEQQLLQRYSIFSAGASAVRKESFFKYGMFNSEYDEVCDLEFAFRVFSNGGKLKPIPNKFIYYRRHDDSMGIKNRPSQLVKEDDILNKIQEKYMEIFSKDKLYGILLRIWNKRKDLQKAFPKFPLNIAYKFRGTITILEWAKIHGIKEEKEIRDYFGI